MQGSGNYGSYPRSATKKSLRIGIKRFSAGEVEAAGAVAAGEAAAVASTFLRARRFAGDGDAAGDSAVEGDAASSAGEAVAAAFLGARCFAGEGDAAGTTLGASN